jgi:hypothetical protein
MRFQLVFIARGVIVRHSDAHHWRGASGVRYELKVIAASRTCAGLSAAAALSRCNATIRRWILEEL